MRYEVSYEYQSYTYESEKDTINGFIQDYSRPNLVKNKEKHLVLNRALRLKSVRQQSHGAYPFRLSKST